MTEHKDRTFDSLFDRGEALEIEGLKLVGCTFQWCGFALTTEISRRSIVRNVQLLNCRENGCEVGPGVLEDVTIADLQTNDLLILWGTVFSRVALTGRIGKVKINPYVDAVDRSERTQGPFDEFRDRFYSSIDWALDISDARFKEFDYRGIPSHLIRRDPETQMLVTRERALADGWRGKLSPGNVHWPFVIDLFLSDGDPDLVLVVPLGAPKKKRDRLLSELNELRDLGVVTP